MKTAAVAVIIPTYNEAENCKLLVNAIVAQLPEAEIIIADDQSPDGTDKVIKNLQKKYPQLQLLIGEKKHGRGAAVKRGLTYALKKTNADFFIEMDADFSHKPSDLPRLLAATTKNTVVIASRYVTGGGVENWPLWRQIFSRCANWAIGLSTGLSLADNTNGFRSYPRRAVSLVLEHEIASKSYLSLSEMAVILKQHGFLLIEIPTIFPNRVRGTSNTTIREIINNLSELLQLRQRYKKGCTCNV